MELALSFDADDAARIENCAAMMNMSAMEFVRGAALARVERETAARNAKNLAEIDAAIENFKKEKGRAITSEDMPQLLDLIADVCIEQVAAERLSRPTGKCITFDEMLAESGITREELDAMPEVEIE